MDQSCLLDYDDEVYKVTGSILYETICLIDYYWCTQPAYGPKVYKLSNIA